MPGVQVLTESIVRSPASRRFGGRAYGLLVGCVAAMFVLGVGPAQAAETGVVPDITWGVSRDAQDRTAAEMGELGARWARLNISWSDWAEPSKGSYGNTAFNHFDRGIDLARAAGYRVMITVEESPGWARDSSNKNHPPRDYADLADFMGYVAARYAGKVEAYQVWNEPNLKWAWPTASGPNAGEYARMLRTVAPAIRAQDSNAKVVFAGLNTNDYAYLGRAYAEVPNLGQYFDVMASHPYTFWGAEPERVWYDTNGRISRGAFAGYRELRKTMQAHGDTKPIWFTEFGWATTSQSLGVSPQTQADYLVRALRCLEQDPYVEIAHWYNLRNTYWENDADTWSAQLGLLNTDFTRKPAFNALKNHQPGTGTCTYTGLRSSSEPAPTEPVGELVATASGEIAVPTDTSHGAASDRLPGLLVVRSALIRRGRLQVTGHHALGATGIVRGEAEYAGRSHLFATSIDPHGRVRIDEVLPDADGVSTARLKLEYSGDHRFRPQRLRLRAAAGRARLQVEQLPHARSAGSDRAMTLRGEVAGAANGRVGLRVFVQTADGVIHRGNGRTRLTDGMFEQFFMLPAGARFTAVQVVFKGGRSPRVGGATTALRLG